MEYDVALKKALKYDNFRLFLQEVEKQHDENKTEYAKDLIVWNYATANLGDKELAKKVDSKMDRDRSKLDSVEVLKLLLILNKGNNQAEFYLKEAIAKQLSRRKNKK